MVTRSSLRSLWQGSIQQGFLNTQILHYWMITQGRKKCQTFYQPREARAFSLEAAQPHLCKRHFLLSALNGKAVILLWALGSCVLRQLNWGTLLTFCKPLIIHTLFHFTSSSSPLLRKHTNLFRLCMCGTLPMPLIVLVTNLCFPFHSQPKREQVTKLNGYSKWKVTIALRKMFITHSIYF